MRVRHLDAVKRRSWKMVRFYRAKNTNTFVAKGRKSETSNVKAKRAKSKERNEENEER
jgi:hypothetical protein